jgi:cytochrome c-type biogenesis protein CcmH
MTRSALGLAAAFLSMIGAAGLFLIGAAGLFMIEAAAPPAALAASPHPRASLTDIENDVMCTLCHESLAVANSPQADSERTYIRGLIAKGETKQQILNNLVAQYGEGVLGRPPASGFNLTVYVLPPAILAIGIVILLITLPRWRRRTRAAKSRSTGPPPDFDPADTARLDQELSQFRG